jgi:hypothetical protein
MHIRNRDTHKIQPPTQPKRREEKRTWVYKNINNQTKTEKRTLGFTALERSVANQFAM